MTLLRKTRDPVGARNGRAPAFTLIELLVVVSIIALLVAIGIPGFTSARNSAKRATTSVMIKTLSEGLEGFKNDNEKDHPQSNGYPSSAKREDPALLGAQDAYGAHWLLRALIGKDFQGYIPRRIVPEVRQNPTNTLAEEVDWYDPVSTGPPFSRIAPYVSLGALRTELTGRIQGNKPNSMELFPQTLTEGPTANPLYTEAAVFADPWGYPILYYAAPSFPKAICSSSGNFRETLGYQHSDNEGFTGKHGNSYRGWYFEGIFPHDILEICPQPMSEEQLESEPTFARYIHNHKLDELGGGPIRVLKPYNIGRFLLISAGADARYGTNDDVNNFDK